MGSIHLGLRARVLGGLVEGSGSAGEWGSLGRGFLSPFLNNSKASPNHADRVAGARKPETVGDYGGSRGFGTSKGSGAVDDGIVFEYP